MKKNDLYRYEAAIDSTKSNITFNFMEFHTTTITTNVSLMTSLPFLTACSVSNAQ